MTSIASSTTTLHVDQIVAGKVGHFVILGFRTIDGQPWAQLKAYDLPTARKARGELALPCDILTPVDYDVRALACMPAAVASLVALRKTRFYDTWDAIVVTARKFRIDAEDLSDAWDAPTVADWCAKIAAE